MKISQIIIFLERRKQEHGDADLVGNFDYVHGKDLIQVEFDMCTVKTQATVIPECEQFDLKAVRIPE